TSITQHRSRHPHCSASRYRISLCCQYFVPHSVKTPAPPDDTPLEHSTERNMRTLQIAPIIIGCILLAGCSTTKTIRVAVGPRVDLHPYPIVGLVTFASNA